MRFCLIDRVVEREADRLVALKLVTSAEEYLGDHFPGFPVLPGVMMVEALVQAARELEGEPRLMVQSVRALKYGSFVKPGESLRVEVAVTKREAGGVVTVKATGHRVTAGAPDEASEEAVAVSGRLVLRPVRVWDGLAKP